MHTDEEDDKWSHAYDNDMEPPQEGEEANPDEHVTAADGDDENEDSPVLSDVPDDHDQQRTGRNHDAYVTTDAQGSQDKPEYQLPSDVFSRPGALEEIATMFVRQKPIDQLEEEWSTPGGIREQVRHEFKVRRQKAASAHSSAPARVR